LERKGELTESDRIDPSPALHPPAGFGLSVSTALFRVLAFSRSKARPAVHAGGGELASVHGKARATFLGTILRFARSERITDDAQSRMDGFASERRPHDIARNAFFLS
jgi:hypothetical protein